MQPLSKEQLKKEIKLFFQDKDRGISKDLFAEMAGITVFHLIQVFEYEKEPLTENVQRKVNKAYMQWKRGEVSVMRRRDNTRFVSYKKDPKTPWYPQMKIDLSGGQAKINLGPVNRHDYSNFKEILSKRG